MNFFAFVKDKASFCFHLGGEGEIVYGEFGFVYRNSAAFYEPSRFAF